MFSKSSVFQGLNVTFYVFEGVVSNSAKEITSSVYSTGGGGLIVDGKGYINAPTVNTLHTESTSFWIREKDGGEENVVIGTNPVPFRNGHVLQVVRASRNEKRTGYVVFLRNKTTGKFSAIVDGFEPFFKSPMEIFLVLTFLSLPASILYLAAILLVLSGDHDGLPARAFMFPVLTVLSLPLQLLPWRWLIRNRSKKKLMIKWIEENIS
jgi:hypothetical protein